MTHTLDTLMALADAITGYPRSSIGRAEARAALSTAIAELVAERDALQRELNTAQQTIDNAREQGSACAAERDALLKSLAPGAAQKENT